MKLIHAYALSLACSSELAMLAVLLGGEMPSACWLALLAPWVLAARLWRDAAASASSMRRGNSQLLGTLLATGGVLGGAAVVLGRGVPALIVGAALALLGILAGRLVSREHLGHDLQACLLSLLLIFAAAGLHTQLTYAIVFICYAPATAWTLATRQLCLAAEREAGRKGGASLSVTLARRDLATPQFFVAVGSLALLVLLSTSVLFVVFPRIGLGQLSLLDARRRVLPDNVRLDVPPRGSGSSAVLMRVAGLTYEQFAGGLYMRSGIYDAIDGFGVSRSQALLQGLGREQRMAAAGPLVYEVFLQPVVGQVLPTLGQVQKARILAGGAPPVRPLYVVSGGAAGGLWASAQPTLALSYRVVGEQPVHAEALNQEAGAEALTPRESLQLGRYLKLPDELDPRVRSLAQRLSARATGFVQRAALLRQHLRSAYSYDLVQPSEATLQPLAHFLFDSHRGHCEFFAVAYAALLRAAGIPARVVGGFAFGAWDDAAELAVFSAADAHAWVEWYLPKVGWVVDDATPRVLAEPAHLVGVSAWLERLARFWDERVVDYGLAEQLALLRELHHVVAFSPRRQFDATWRIGAVGLATALVVLAGLLVWRRYKPRSRAAAGGLARALSRACSRVGGIEVTPAVSLRQAVNDCLPKAATHGQILGAALARYEQSRFGRQPLDGDEERRLVRALSSCTRIKSK